MKQKPKSQIDRIFNYLARGHKLTPIQALQKFGCFRLAARINDLRASGVNIETATVTKNGKTYAQYKLAA